MEDADPHFRTSLRILFILHHILALQ